MSKKNRLVGVAAVLAVFVVIAMLVASRPTAAQSGNPITPICASLTNQNALQYQDWMQKQLQTGRTRFVTIPNGLCAY
jgi:hypothetical protein